ncbi:hypothetical protein TRP8649_00140 [Pelagimonas phthalicica]|uniref:DUF2783 domain-containing protein n=1 Tax=Pelagimonas phthalicica TaxID=1037362 RepID=A0A238J7C8_9RHOB|nr:DUF2783 domain-containing protein [Pelagimonas phthalicica]TDS95409.1 uncharacterized protein DUF2783 [Pelagimonas phthalicica]SMX26067.1 hypothetical protein TRP8649_00140 [Pelagimonas phthalicica]
MSSVNTKPNFADPDGFYAKLIEAHDGLSDEESAALNARLILILSNHIGDSDVLNDAMTMARNAGQG